MKVKPLPAIINYYFRSTSLLTRFMKTQLSFVFLLLLGKLVFGQYQVDSIPYLPAAIPDSSIMVFDNPYSDDKYSGEIDMGFDFCFYGTTYNKCVVGSNGIVSFHMEYANTICPYEIVHPIPSSLNPLNAILIPWEDIYNRIPKQVVYFTTGTAPNRKFVVSFDSIPMYECDSLIDGFQVVLFETTNVIETHIANKSVCPDWWGGMAIQGVQDKDGVNAQVVRDRNYPNQWTAQQEGWRFTPMKKECFTGLEETKLEVGLQVYPNPAFGSVNLETNRPLQEADLYLQDVYGREIVKVAGINGLHYKLKTELLVTGTYFLTLKEGHETVARSTLFIGK